MRASLNLSSSGALALRVASSRVRQVALLAVRLLKFLLELSARAGVFGSADDVEHLPDRSDLGHAKAYRFAGRRGRVYQWELSRGWPR